MIRVRVILEEAKIHRRMDTGGKPLAVLPVGREFNLGKVHKETSEKWVEASLPDGRSGFVTGTTKLRVIYPVTTSRAALLRKSADAASPVLTELPAHSRMDLLDVIETNAGSWSLVRLPDGREGCLPPDVEFKREQKKKKRSPGQYAVYGSGLVLAGLFLRRFLGTASGNSFLDLLAWAGIIAGGALIIYSFFLAMRKEALKKPPPKKR